MLLNRQVVLPRGTPLSVIKQAAESGAYVLVHPEDYKRMKVEEEEQARIELGSLSDCHD